MSLRMQAPLSAVTKLRSEAVIRLTSSEPAGRALTSGARAKASRDLVCWTAWSEPVDGFERLLECI